jgi:predicted Zn-dependent protease with MMP-like domain
MMENVAVCIEEEGFGQTKKGLRISGNLLGLYEGVPQNTYGRGIVSGRLPDKITIFKKNIEKASKNKEDVEELVKIVVWHEIAHHFGFGEKEVKKLESKWRKK